jgi:hypothetical protein
VRISMRKTLGVMKWKCRLYESVSWAVQGLQVIVSAAVSSRISGTGESVSRYSVSVFEAEEII